MRRAVVELYPDGELLSGGNRGQRILSRRWRRRALRRNQRGLKRKIERQVERGPGLRFFLPQTGQQVLLLIAAAKPESSRRLSESTTDSNGAAALPGSFSAAFSRLSNIGFDLLPVLSLAGGVESEKSRSLQAGIDPVEEIFFVAIFVGGRRQD